MSLPQPLHFSAALALVKSKPKHLTIQGQYLPAPAEIQSDILPDYIENLRDCIETSCHHDRTIRHLNTSAFWQKQYDHLHRVLEKEQDAKFVLQEENNALQAQITQLLARSKPGRKRKSAEEVEPETIKKMKAGTIAIAEFGPAADVDPGLTVHVLYQT